MRMCAAIVLRRRTQSTRFECVIGKGIRNKGEERQETALSVERSDVYYFESQDQRIRSLVYRLTDGQVGICAKRQLDMRWRPLSPATLIGFL